MLDEIPNSFTTGLADGKGHCAKEFGCVFLFSQFQIDYGLTMYEMSAVWQSQLIPG